MRILLMIQHLWRGGGTESHVITLARGLRAAGHDVVIYTSGGPWIDKARRSGATVIENAAMNHGSSAAVNSFVRFLRHHHFHVIHAHDGSSLDLAARARLRLRGLPSLVYTVHGPYVGSRRLRYAAQVAQAVIGVSEPMRVRAIRRGGMSPGMVHTVLNGIDTGVFRPRSKVASRARLGLPRDAFVVGYAGRFTFDKIGLSTRVGRTIKQYAGMNRRTFALIAGRNANRLVSSSSTTKVLGHVGHMEVFFSACDVVVGTARVAAEALACGVPTIVIGVGGYHGLVTPGNIGRMLSNNFGDHAEGRRSWPEDRLRHRISWVRRHYSSVERDTQHVRLSVIRVLSSDRMVKHVVSVYRSIL